MGAMLCLDSNTFKVSFMALDNDLTHASMFNTFAPDVLNSLQNKNWCTCTVRQLRILVSFDDYYFSKALHTVHFTVQNAELRHV